MNRKQKIEKVVTDIMNLQVTDGSYIFSKTLPDKLRTVIRLMHFPQVSNEAFKKYLGYFQHDTEKDILRCHQINNRSNMVEKEQVLQTIQLHMKARVKVVDFAFAMYLKDKTIFLKEEDRKVASKLQTANTISVYEWLFNHDKGQAGTVAS